MSNFHGLATKIKKAQKAFQKDDETDLPTMIDMSLDISCDLLNDVPFEQYAEIHSLCIAFFGILKQKLTEKNNKYSQTDIENAFYLALAFEKLVPRLYIALIIACSAENQIFLDMVINMLPAVSHPLRGFMLRYSAISFFPTKSAKLPDFSYNNFCEMLYLLPKFQFSSHSTFDAAVGWLSTNISISLFSAQLHNKYVNLFLSKAAEVEDQQVKLNIVSSVAQTTQPSFSLIENMKPFLDVFAGLEISEESSRVILFICTKSKSPKDSFDFVTKTKFSEICKEKVTQMAIKYEDYDTLVRCMKEWPSDDVFMQAYVGIGIHKFANYIPDGIKPSSPVILKFLEETDRKVPKEAIYKMIHFLDSGHSDKIEESLFDILKKKYCEPSYVRELFDINFVFVTTELFLKVMDIFYTDGMKLDEMLRYIEKADRIDTTTKITVICQIWPKGETDTFFKAVAKYELSQLNLGQIFPVFSRLEISDNILKEFYKKCEKKDALIPFLCYVVGSAGFHSYIQEVVIRLFELDFVTKSLRKRVDLYIDTLSAMLELTDDIPKREIFEQIFEIIHQIFQVAKRYPRFQLECDKGNVKRWKERLEAFKESMIYKQYSDKIALILDCCSQI